MALTKQKKVEILGEITQALAKAKSAVFINFHGLTVSKANTLRRGLRTSGITYNVTKKTLARKVLVDAKIAGTIPDLPGEIAIAFGEDLTTPAREVYRFQKEFKEGLSIVGGVFDGRFMDRAEMLEIAAIPPTQVLYGQFVNLINSPIQGLVMALNGIAGKKN